jgi:uncharacterized membrane protein YqjE
MEKFCIDGITKLFIFMLIVSLIFGTIVLVTHPDYRVKNVYQTKVFIHRLTKIV